MFMAFTTITGVSTNATTSCGHFTLSAIKKA